MIREIFIIQESSSLLLFDRTYMKKNISMNRGLFSGMITALSNFMNEIKIGEIQHFQTGENLVLITPHKDVIIVAVVEEQDEDDFVKIAIKKVIKEFSNHYSQVLKTWRGNTMIFEPFLKVCDEIILSEFIKRYISTDFPRNMIKHIREFQLKFQPDIIDLIGVKTGTVRARLLKSQKGLRKLLKRELDQFSINSIKEVASDQFTIDIEVCPICRNIKEQEFNCRFLRGFIQGFTEVFFQNKQISVYEFECCAWGNESCKYNLIFDDIFF